MVLCYIVTIISFQKQVRKQPLKSSLAAYNIVFAFTFPETNITPEKWWLEQLLSFWEGPAHFQGRAVNVSFREGTTGNIFRMIQPSRPFWGPFRRW